MVHDGVVRQPARHRLVVALEPRSAAEAAAPTVDRERCRRTSRRRRELVARAQAARAALAAGDQRRARSARCRSAGPALDASVAAVPRPLRQAPARGRPPRRRSCCARSRAAAQVLENTVVVFTSDHGEYGGSHGLRGKGAGMYEEGDPRAADRQRLHRQPRRACRAPCASQLTSSVDVAPLLLTIAQRLRRLAARPGATRSIATRADLLAIARDPAAPGRDYALHATDEVVTEFALLPYAADAPLHVAGHHHADRTSTRPTATGAGHDRARSPATQEAELYDYTTPAGYSRSTTSPGAARWRRALRAALEQATLERAARAAPVHARRRPAARARGVPRRSRRRSAAVSTIHRLQRGRADRSRNRAPPAVGSAPARRWGVGARATRR